MADDVFQVDEPLFRLSLYPGRGFCHKISIRTAVSSVEKSFQCKFPAVNAMDEVKAANSCKIFLEFSDEFLLELPF